MSTRSPKKYVVAIDLDYTALISNDLGGLRGAIHLDALSDDDALALVQRVANPRLLEAVAALRKRGRVDRLVFYTAKGGLLEGLPTSDASSDLWIRQHTLRFRAGPSSRWHLYNQLPPGSTPQHRADFVGLGVLTWGLSQLLGLRTLAAPVYITREGKDPAFIAHDLDVQHVVLFDDQAETYAAQLPPASLRDGDRILRAVAPYDYECLTPAQAKDFEAFLQARCGPPLADSDVSEGQAWRIVARARGQPLPPWFTDDL
jgi:hypothetical protein